MLYFVPAVGEVLSSLHAYGAGVGVLVGSAVGGMYVLVTVGMKIVAVGSGVLVGAVVSVGAVVLVGMAAAVPVSIASAACMVSRTMASTVACISAGLVVGVAAGPNKPQPESSNPRPSTADNKNKEYRFFTRFLLY